MAYKMKQGNKKNHTCSSSSPVKGLFGGIMGQMGGLGKIAGKAAKSGMLGPIGAAAGASGLFMKDSPMEMCGCGKKNCDCK